MSETSTKAARIVLLVVVIAVSYGAKLLFDQRAADPFPPAGTQSSSDNDASIVRLFQEQRSGVMISGGGTIDRMLSDDVVGDQHQRMVLRLSNGHTLLISHNIDLAPRVPAQVGDRLSFRGQYEWNERGGVVHWTHHDPRGRRAGGWLRHDGQRYE